MTREIKFRAWDKKEKQFVSNFGVNWFLTNTGNIVYDYKPEIHMTPESLDWVVMQYTGLKDKNGTPIFEGGIS